MDANLAEPSISLEGEKLHVDILPQPDDTTCGPTCLHAVYRYYGDIISLTQVVREVRKLKGGGTLAVFLACHALKRGYRAKIYTYNLHVFDPTWFVAGKPVADIASRLRAQAEAKNIPKLKTATEGYLEFLSLGGELRFEDLTTGLLRKYLKRSIPIITGLCSTFLYRSIREVGAENRDDDVRGEPSGHFVVLCGYSKEERSVLLADPYQLNPVSHSQYYSLSIDRVACSILLGILTYDANFLLIEPKRLKKQEEKNADSHSGQRSEGMAPGH